MGVLKIERKGEVDWVTLDRPAQLNALDPELISALDTYLTGLRTDPGVRIVVLKGAGRGFCSGADLQALQADGALTPARLWEIQTSISRVITLLRTIPQPVVSLVHGPACGGGFSIALASDIRIAGRSARMNAAFIRVGLSGCDMGVSYLLPRLVGASLASELLLTGEFITADRALALGLVSRVSDDDRLEAEAEPLIAAMLRASPVGLRMTKEILRLNIDAPSLEAAIAVEDRTQLLCASYGGLAEAVEQHARKRAGR